MLQLASGGLHYENSVYNKYLCTMNTSVILVGKDLMAKIIFPFIGNHEPFGSYLPDAQMLTECITVGRSRINSRFSIHTTNQKFCWNQDLKPGPPSLWPLPTPRKGALYFELLPWTWPQKLSSLLIIIIITISATKFKNKIHSLFVLELYFSDKTITPTPELKKTMTMTRLLLCNWCWNNSRLQLCESWTENEIL